MSQGDRLSGTLPEYFDKYIGNEQNACNLFVSLRRTHDAKRHISFVGPCASVIVYKFNLQRFHSFTMKKKGDRKGVPT